MIRIRDWKGTWETHETRKAVKLRWVSLPVDLSSSGYTELMLDPLGCETYGIFCALVAVAAAAPERGTLTRLNGRPYTLPVLAGAIRVDPPKLRAALPKLREIGWIECDDNAEFSELLGAKAITSSPEISGDSPENSVYRTGPDRTEQDRTRQDKTEQDTSSLRDEKSPPSGRGNGVVPSPNDDQPPKRSRKPRAQKPTRPPTTWEDRPIPGDVLAAWDATYLRTSGRAYPRTAGAKEAALAAKVIDAVGKTGGDWQRIPRAIENALADEWAKDKGFAVFASQFAKFDGPGKFNPWEFLANCDPEECDPFAHLNKAGKPDGLDDEGIPY